MAGDQAAARAYALKVWKYKEGELVALMVHLGDRLGLYRAMADNPPVTSEQLADLTNSDERWVREWLLGQAAADLVVRHGDGTYQLPEEAGAVLVDEESLLFASGGFTGGIAPAVVDKIIGAFRTGIGFGYGDMDEATAVQIDRSNGPWLRNFLVPVVIPALDGVHEKLLEGTAVLDIGCGGGIAIEALARRYPNSTFLGVDVSPFAIDLAQANVADLPNASVELVDGAALGDRGPFGLVMTLECLHDAAHPEALAGAARAAVAEDGTWLIKDIKTAARFEDNQRNPLLALMYGYSITSCLGSATKVEGGAALGTMGLHAELAERLAHDAGFSTFTTHDFDDPTHRYYEARP